MACTLSLEAENGSLISQTC